MAQRKTRTTKMMHNDYEYTIETWWDGQSSNWISQILDDEGNQVGEAHYAANRPDAHHKYTLGHTSFQINLEYEFVNDRSEFYGDFL